MKKQIIIKLKNGCVLGPVEGSNDQYWYGINGVLMNIIHKDTVLTEPQMTYVKEGMAKIKLMQIIKG
jgi:hypothetical protein